MRCCHLPNYNVMSFERHKLFLLFQSLVEDSLAMLDVSSATGQGGITRVPWICHVLLRHLPPTHTQRPSLSHPLYKTTLFARCELRRLHFYTVHLKTVCYYARIMKTYQHRPSKRPLVSTSWPSNRMIPTHKHIELPPKRQVYFILF